MLGELQSDKDNGGVHNVADVVCTLPPTQKAKVAVSQSSNGRVGRKWGREAGRIYNSTLQCAHDSQDTALLKISILCLCWATVRLVRQQGQTEIFSSSN